MTCPKPNAHGRCGCPGFCGECGFRRHTVVHGTPGNGAPQYVHEFVSVNPDRKNGGE
jgi:hypothetical protein